MRKTGKSRVGHQIGLSAEEIAAAAYQRRSGRVLGRRVRNAAGEIDLIVECASQTIFVEVKARLTLDRAAAALTARQTRRIGNAALVWLAESGRSPDAVRFDVVLVDRSGDARILENALSFDEISY